MDPPLGCSQPFFAGMELSVPSLRNGLGFSGSFASGWEISSLAALQSGLPFSVYTGGALSVEEAPDGQSISALERRLQRGW